jgi:site-specific DNA recombinase
MKTYCKQHNFVIVNTYIDEAKSATTDRRPAFQQMIADSSNKTFDIVLVHKLDRFARNRYDSAVYKRELKKNGVQVYSVLENLDNSPESIMMEAVLEGMSEYYSQNLSREGMKGMRENALKCHHTGGKPPLGSDVDTNSRKLVVNEHEAEAVKIIFTLYSQGYGYSHILATLHEKGYKTKNGKEFQKNSLYSILTNPKYQGTYVFNRCSAKSITGTRNTHLLKDAEDIISIDGGCPQIVPTEVYENVQKRITEHKHTGGRLNAKQNYLLSGKVFCKECGRSMVGNTRYSGRDKTLYITYRCPSKRYCCSNKEINRDYLEKYVVELLEAEILNSSSLLYIEKQLESLSSAPPPPDYEAEAKLAEVNTALKNVADAVAQGLLSEALITHLRELEQQKAELERTLQEIDTPSGNVNIDTSLILSNYREVKDSPASPAYKEFICGFISKIDVGRYTVDITLKTGLDICKSLDTTYPVRRQEVYERKKTV